MKKRKLHVIVQVLRQCRKLEYSGEKHWRANSKHSDFGTNSHF